MRTLLRWVTNRYGIVGILVLSVLAIVGVARLAGGEADRPGSAAPGEDPHASISLGPDDGVYEGPTADPNDPPPQPGSNLTVPAGRPDPRPVAERFAASWANHDGVAPETWRDRLARYATASLMERLAATDPAAVPTDSITGKADLISVTGRSRAGVTLEAKGGLLVLGMTYADHRWAVDSIDWRRG
jgi:hypothetical protein